MRDARWISTELDESDTHRQTRRTPELGRRSVIGLALETITKKASRFLEALKAFWLLGLAAAVIWRHGGLQHEGLLLSAPTRSASTLARCSCLLGNRTGKLQQKRGQIVRHDLPNDVVVDIVVAVNQTVSQTDDRRPRNTRSAGLFLLRNAAGRFTDDLEQSDDRKSQEAIGIQIAPVTSLHEFDHFVRMVPHLAQAHRRITPRQTGPRPPT